MRTAVKKNSIDCYHGIVEGAMERSQNERVKECLKVKAMTGKMISVKTGIVPGEVSRCLGQLRKSGEIIFSHDAKCEESKITAAYWKLPEIKKPEAVADKNNQFTMFQTIR